MVEVRIRIALASGARPNEAFRMRARGREEQRRSKGACAIGMTASEHIVSRRPVVAGKGLMGVPVADIRQENPRGVHEGRLSDPSETSGVPPKR